jgi:hypothetical protein
MARRLLRDLAHSNNGILAESHGLASAPCATTGVSAMKQDAGQKAHCKFGAPSVLETGHPRANDPQQGARLVRAFLRITDPRVRLAIVHMIEKMESVPADC